MCRRSRTESLGIQRVMPCIFRLSPPIFSGGDALYFQGVTPVFSACHALYFQGVTPGIFRLSPPIFSAYVPYDLSHLTYPLLRPGQPNSPSPCNNFFWKELNPPPPPHT